MTRLPCGDCLGQGVGPEGACEACGGRGWVIAAPARDALSEILRERGHLPGDVLDTLDEHRPDLVAWLIETRTVIPTAYGLEPVPGTPYEIPSWSANYRPPFLRIVDLTDLTDKGYRLFRVVDQ